MKKLSKILVIVLTLAMLLGVVVVSASASGKNFDVLDSNGVELYSDDTLSKAVDFANGYDKKGDITIRVNNNGKSLDKAVTITRDAEEYGKVILDLNGNTLGLAVANTVSLLAYAKSAGDGSVALVDVILVKDSVEATTSTPYDLNGFSFEGAVLDENGAESLYGSGDMLIKTDVSASLIRGQGVFVRDHEIEKIAKFCKEQ